MAASEVPSHAVPPAVAADETARAFLARVRGNSRLAGAGGRFSSLHVAAGVTLRPHTTDGRAGVLAIGGEAGQGADALLERVVARVLTGDDADGSEGAPASGARRGGRVLFLAGSSAPPIHRLASILTGMARLEELKLKDPATVEAPLVEEAVRRRVHAALRGFQLARCSDTLQLLLTLRRLGRRIAGGKERPPALLVLHGLATRHWQDRRWEVGGGAGLYARVVEALDSHFLRAGVNVLMYLPMSAAASKALAGTGRAKSAGHSDYPHRALRRIISGNLTVRRVAADACVRLAASGGHLIDLDTPDVLVDEATAAVQRGRPCYHVSSDSGHGYTAMVQTDAGIIALPNVE